MKKLPEYLSCDSEQNFKDHRHNLILDNIRLDLHDYMLTRKDSSVVFDLDSYIHTFPQDSITIKNNLSEALIKELEVLGWVCKMMYGNTAILIYNKNNPPILIEEDILLYRLARSTPR